MSTCLCIHSHVPTCTYTHTHTNIHLRKHTIKHYNWFFKLADEEDASGSGSGSGSESGSDDDMPGMPGLVSEAQKVQQEMGAAGGVATDPEGSNKMSRSEKKARRAMSKLRLKEVLGT